MRPHKRASSEQRAWRLAEGCQRPKAKAPPKLAVNGDREPRVSLITLARGETLGRRAPGCGTPRPSPGSAVAAEHPPWYLLVGFGYSRGRRLAAHLDHLVDMSAARLLHPG